MRLGIVPLFVLLAPSACVGPGEADPTSSARLTRAAVGHMPRLLLSGNRVTGIATPIDGRDLPAAVRTTLDAIAPDGTLEYCADEWGPRGEGYRIEKSYAEPVAHQRSLLVAGDGAVLERAHTLPLDRVPQHVLATALAHGNAIESAWIVSGPEDEEYWLVVIQDRRSQTFAVQIGLDGRQLSAARRNQTLVDSLAVLPVR